VNTLLNGLVRSTPLQSTSAVAHAGITSLPKSVARKLAPKFKLIPAGPKKFKIGGHSRELKSSVKEP